MKSDVIEEAGPVIGDGADWLGIAEGLVWALLSVSILSGWFVVTRLGLRHDLNIWDVVALRFGGGAVILVPTLLAGRSRLPLREWIEGIPLAMLWGAPFILLVGMGLQLTSATLASSIAPALMPVFAGAIGWLMFDKVPRRLQLAGYVLIVAGLGAVLFAYSTVHGWPDMMGILSLVVAAAMWATYTLRVRTGGLSPLQATALICFWSAIAYVPIYLASGLSNLAHASGGELLLQSLYQGLLMSAVAIFAFNRAVVSLGPKAAAAMVALVPAAVTIFAVPVLGEFPSPASSIAICIITVGVMLAAAPASSKNVTSQWEKMRDPLLFPSDAQPGEGRADARRDRAAL